ncbi:polysaccharide deacetylase family protein [Paenibacillus thalictri]|uniref:Polysaccharide deacetylase family protein n=1 Tax=Paenibacillus thalictri TaxID=2527873 RepID=A0A4V2J3R3_9BACL|nr:polysaccharide deacetylase family protein [Paenibacillus thalictri]TBL75029.1 polysaccharide deacetylase family protein [Paenibacillus thalictri]
MIKIIWKAVLLCIIGVGVLVPTLSAAKTNVMYKDQVAVIMYHHIDDYAQSSGTITTKLFNDQLVYLRNKGYQFITLNQFKEFMAGSSVPHNAVLVTFDDGYESFYINAYPILKAMRIPAVNFVITGDLENPLASYIPSLSKDEIVEMTNDTNFIDTQCHTNAFHNKFPDGSAMLVGRMLVNGSPETPDQYKQRVVKDTQACVSKLSELYDEPIDSYAYPYGIYDKTALTYIMQGGMKYAFTILPEMATRRLDPMQIPRINAGNSAITPEGLHNSIMRRVVATDHPYQEVELGVVMPQLGGKASMDKEGNISIQYQNKVWTGKANSQKLVSAGNTLTLIKPLTIKNNKFMIGFDDLQNTLGVPLVYNPNVQSFSVQQTPVVK